MRERCFQNAEQFMDTHVFDVIKIILINFRIWHSFMVHIYVDKIKVITREGRVLILSYEEKELEDFILWQVSSSLRQIVTYFKSIRH